MAEQIREEVSFFVGDRQTDRQLLLYIHHSQGQILTFLLPGRSPARRQPNLDEFSAAIWSRRRFPAHRSNDGFIPSLLLHQNLHQNKLASTVNSFCVCQSLLQSKIKDSHTALCAWVGPIDNMWIWANFCSENQIQNARQSLYCEFINRNIFVVEVLMKCSFQTGFALKIWNNILLMFNQDLCD